MISGHHSTRFVSFLAGSLVCGLVSLPAARAQDAEPAAESPSATPVADPNAPPPGAYPAPPPGGAMPAVQQSAAAAYNPFLLMPFIGIQSDQNDNSGTGPGLRVGGLIGGRISEQFSFNGELLFDWENLNTIPAGVSASAYILQFAAAPLFHLQASPTAEIVHWSQARPLFRACQPVRWRSGRKRQRRGPGGRSEPGRILPGLRCPLLGRPHQLRLPEGGVVQQRPGELHDERRRSQGHLLRRGRAVLVPRGTPSASRKLRRRRIRHGRLCA